MLDIAAELSRQFARNFQRGQPDPAGFKLD